MKTKCFILVVALTVIICISSGRIVRAGSPASSASTTGTATVRGEVKFEGGVPKATPINMAADPSCAKQHPTPVLSQDIVSDAKGGLQNVVVFIADGLGDRTFDPPSQPAVIQQKGCMYQPHVLAVQANQKLDVVNSDTTTHNIHPTPKNNREWNKAQSPHVPIEETFAREEIAIPVKCNVHPWMRGYIAVFKHPYFAVTDNRGSFELKNVPPGEYTIQAWHEKYGALTQKVNLAPNQSQEVEFVFKPRAAD